ncbi:MAG: substrate-binding domain-containing protein [Acidobacteria bacterium]|nr:substrate-binding domain-containing protein [Acidobacteriota bacterium]
MKTFRSGALLIAVGLLAAPCFAHHMAVIVSEENTVQNLTSTQLGKIFRSETKKWPSGKNITLVLHRSSPGETVTMAHVNRISTQQWEAWINEHQDSVKLLDSDEEVLSYVASTPGAVGLVDVRSVNDRVKVVHVDGKLPLEAGYLPH